MFLKLYIELLLFVKKSLVKLGIDIRRYMPGNTYWASLVRMLSCHDIDLVLDVGANTGQFVEMLRQSGYKGKIISFEPLSHAHEILVRNALHDPLWTVAPRMALGDVDGEVSINISANSVSSSLANMLATHRNAVPESNYVGNEKVPVARLDSIADRYISPASRIFVKIDTQGYELHVLAGATTLLQRVCGVQLEISLVPLYEGSGLFTEIVMKMNELGFGLHGVFDAYTDQHTGRMLQVDGIFFRTDQG
jgi:FkbM family methyltransferase